MTITWGASRRARFGGREAELIITVLFKHDVLGWLLTPTPVSWWEGFWFLVLFLPLFALRFPQPWVGVYFQEGWTLPLDLFFWSQILLLNCLLGCLYAFWFP